MNEDIDVQVMVLDCSILTAKMLPYLPRLILKAMYLEQNMMKTLLRISRSLCGSSAQAQIFENQGGVKHGPQRWDEMILGSLAKKSVSQEELFRE